jgi:ABC-2 type transport system ATP-binding protein
MDSVAAEGRTVLLSSHQIGEVERVADIVAILRAGKLVLVERLETLKDQIRELNITLAENAPSVPRLPGAILSERRHRHQWQVLVRGISENELAALNTHSGIQELRIRTPSLEEIFVAYLKTADSQGPTPSSPAEASVS